MFKNDKFVPVQYFIYLNSFLYFFKHMLSFFTQNNTCQILRGIGNSGRTRGHAVPKLEKKAQFWHSFVKKKQLQVNSGSHVALPSRKQSILKIKGDHLAIHHQVLGD